MSFFCSHENVTVRRIFFLNISYLAFGKECFFIFGEDRHFLMQGVSNYYRKTPRRILQFQ